MGTYSTATDIRKLYKKIDTVNLTDTDLEFYITLSEAEIDSLLARRYSLPFSSTPPILRSISAEYALIKIIDRFFTAENPSKNDWREIRKRDMKELLKGLSDGSMELVDSSGGVIAESAGTTELWSSTEGYIPTFGVGHYGDEIVDINRVADEQDDRDNE